MKVFIVLSVLIVAVISVPIKTSRDARIMKYDNVNNGIDGYDFV